MSESEFPWTQDHWGDQVEDPVPRVAGWHEKLAWFGVIAVVVVVFEMTADPALTVSVGCLKFGWDEFRLAGWLKRTDPDRQRGKTCSRFYLAWGLWRISLVAIAVAFCLAFVTVTLEGHLGKPRGVGGPPPGFAGALLLALLGFFLCSVVSSLAVFSALRHRVKVWVGPEARWAREQNLWPPSRAAGHGLTANRTKVILLSVLITAVVVGFFLIFLPLSFYFF